MKKRNGISAIGILLTLLITALLFLYFAGNLFKTNNTKDNNNSLNVTNEEINQKLDEIQSQRIDAQNAQQEQINELKNKF